MSNEQRPGVPSVSVERVDHVAIEVDDFDVQLARMTDVLGMHCKRIGRYNADPSRRIAMVADESGFKIELIEGTGMNAGPVFRHVAWRVRDVPAAFDALVTLGFVPFREPRRIEAARGTSAFVTDASGFPVQLVEYDEGSPDL
jgi:catechol 2,3-dioxygenase-like lactoylglutathione lyase family enzyme